MKIWWNPVWPPHVTPRMERTWIERRPAATESIGMTGLFRGDPQWDREASQVPFSRPHLGHVSTEKASAPIAVGEQMRRKHHLPPNGPLHGPLQWAVHPSFPRAHRGNAEGVGCSGDDTRQRGSQRCTVFEARIVNGPCERWMDGRLRAYGFVLSKTTVPSPARCVSGRGPGLCLLVNNGPEPLLGRYG